MSLSLCKVNFVNNSKIHFVNREMKLNYHSVFVIQREIFTFEEK